MTTTVYTNIEVADATVELFYFLRTAKKGWSIFEKIYGQPFDIMKFAITDYVPYKSDGWPFIDGYELNIGNGWVLRLQIKQGDMVTYSRNSPIPDTFTVHWCFQNNFCKTVKLLLINGKISNTYNSKLAEHTWIDIFSVIKRRAAITIREHKKYLANSAFYDTLEAEFNIKSRKKK